MSKTIKERCLEEAKKLVFDNAETWDCDEALMEVIASALEAKETLLEKEKKHGDMLAEALGACKKLADSKQSFQTATQALEEAEERGLEGYVELHKCRRDDYHFRKGQESMKAKAVEVAKGMENEFWDDGQYQHTDSGIKIAKAIEQIEIASTERLQEGE